MLSTQVIRLFCLIAVAVSSAAQAQDTIVEACQGGQNSGNYAEISGQWSNSNDPATERSSAPGLTAAAGCPSRKLPPGQAGEARFYPRFNTAGHYCVYVTWPSSANVKQVLYVTRAGGNQTAKSIVQNGIAFRNPPNGNKWIYLGEWDFAAGGDDYVAVVGVPKETAPHDSSKPGAMFADAVRFTQQPLTGADGAELLPRDRVEMRGMGSSVPAGAAPLLGVAASGGRAGAAATSRPSAVASGSGASGGTALPGVSAGAAGADTGGAGSIEWMASVQDAQRAVATDKNKRILIYFRTDSQLCQKYDREIFGNPNVLRLIRERYIPVKLDMEKSTETANALGVYRGGTLLVYDAAGVGLKKVTRNLETEDALKELQF